MKNLHILFTSLLMTASLLSTNNVAFSADETSPKKEHEGMSEIDSLRAENDKLTIRIKEMVEQRERMESELRNTFKRLRDCEAHFNEVNERYEGFLRNYKMEYAEWNDRAQHADRHIQFLEEKLEELQPGILKNMLKEKEGKKKPKKKTARKSGQSKSTSMGAQSSSSRDDDSIQTTSDLPTFNVKETKELIKEVSGYITYDETQLLSLPFETAYTETGDVVITGAEELYGILGEAIQEYYEEMSKNEKLDPALIKNEMSRCETMMQILASRDDMSAILFS